RFLGFQTPLVMISDPEATQALYTERGHGLPPGRTVSLQPILGSRSLLLLEGREHLARRKVLLPPFHGERMRRPESSVAAVVAGGRGERLRALTGEIAALLAAELAERRADPREDILSMLVTARFEDGYRGTGLAGSDTSSPEANSPARPRSGLAMDDAEIRD